jgi:transcription-repair coupling factor (superfamily II helicase)
VESLDKINFREKLSDTGYRRTYLSGIQGSAISFMGADVFAEQNLSLLFISTNQESAVYLYNDLQNLIDENKVMYFPASLRTPYEEERTANANIQERAEVLNYINNTSQPFIVVTYPEALFEKVVSKQLLTKNTFEVKLKEKLSVDFLAEYLESFNFGREDFVLEPGQYAVRGGIIDVFSFSNDYPYRIELFGDEIESIRTFDPVSQLSVKNYDRINLIPDVNSDTIAEIKQDFISYLSPDTLVICDNLDLSLQKIQKQFEKAEDIYISLRETIQKEPSEIFCNSVELKNALEKLKWFEYGIRPLFNEKIITFSQSPQPSFHKNFEMLLQNLLENKRKGYKNILFADSQKQAERLEQIFHDISAEKHISADIIEPINLYIHEGFIDHELKVACYTDHQFF